MKKFIISLLTVAMLFAVVAPPALANHPDDNLTEDSEAEVGFRPGPITIDPLPCPDPYSHLFPPYCPWEGDPTDPNNPNLDVGFFVPRFDFGQHENRVGVARRFYAIPAQGSNRMLYGRLGQFTREDIVRVDETIPTAEVAANTVGHFVQLTDARGSFAGWNLTVQRDEFTSVFGNPASPLYGHQLQGVEMMFHGVSAFGLAGSVTNIVDQFASNVPVPVGTPVVIANATPNRGGGTQRIQIGSATADLAAADLAHTYRTATSNRDGTTPHPTTGALLARNTGVSLSIPSNVPTHATDYLSTLTWTLGLAPSGDGVWTPAP